MSGRIAFDRRSCLLVKVVGSALFTALAAFAWLGLAVPESGGDPASPASDGVAPSVIGSWFAAPAPLSDTAPALHGPRPNVAADPASSRMTHRPVEMPYRFAGRSTLGTETSIVLYGRGRVVTVLGPGALDDEYVVEAVSNEYVLIRHVPSSVGTFMATTNRRMLEQPPRDPEGSPRD